MDKRLSTDIRLAAIPIIAGLIVYVELQRSPFFFRLFTFILVFALLANIASLTRGRWRNALLALASLSFLPCIAEGVATILEPWQRITPSFGWAYNSVIGSEPARAGQNNISKYDYKTKTMVFNVNNTIDANRLRQTISAPTGPNVVFFGDAFGFGWALNDSDTLPQLFADSLGRRLRVVNLAMIGAGPQQFLRELQTGTFDPVIGPQPRLFIFVNAIWAANRSGSAVQQTKCVPITARRGPHYALEQGQLVFKGPCYSGAALKLREWLEDSAFYRHFFAPWFYRLDHDDVELCLAVLSGAAKLAKQKYGVPTLIAYIRSGDERLGGTGFDDAGIVKRLEKAGAYVLDVSLLKEQAAGTTILIPGDDHPTASANRIRAAMLKTYIERNLPETLNSDAAQR
jgi:hypothetical protein